MENRPDLIFLNIHKSIKENFDFLFERGFRITGAMFTGKGTENWVVTMLVDDWFIRVHSSRGRVTLGLTTLQLVNEIGFLDLGTMLQFIGEEDDKLYITKAETMNEQQQLKSIAQLFKRYFNELIIQFDNQIDQTYSTSINSVNGLISMYISPFYFPYQSRSTRINSHSEVNRTA